MTTGRVRDYVATELAGWIIRHIATKEFNERFLRVLATGSPEQRAPAPEVVRPRPEAMQWCRQGCLDECFHSWPDHHSALSIVAWVRENGGEARVYPARIAVRTRDGWAHCSPGQWIIKGDWFHAEAPPTHHSPTMPVREFTVADSRPGVSS